MNAPSREEMEKKVWDEFAFERRNLMAGVIVDLRSQLAEAKDELASERRISAGLQLMVDEKMRELAEAKGSREKELREAFGEGWSAYKNAPNWLNREGMVAHFERVSTAFLKREGK